LIFYRILIQHCNSIKSDLCVNVDVKVDVNVKYVLKWMWIAYTSGFY